MVFWRTGAGVLVGAMTNGGRKRDASRATDKAMIHVFGIPSSREPASRILRDGQTAWSGDVNMIP